jgi:hypothetical protein
VKKVTAALTTFYVPDAGGNELSIYTKTGAAAPILAEVPLYGASRLGVAYNNAGALTYTYSSRII